MPVTLYEVVRVYVVTALVCAVVHSGKRTVTITEGVTHGRW